MKDPKNKSPTMEEHKKSSGKINLMLFSKAYEKIIPLSYS
jgi:hypothetical protein